MKKSLIIYSIELRNYMFKKINLVLFAIQCLDCTFDNYEEKPN